MATQQEIAKHLDLSLKGARNMLAKLGIDSRSTTLDQIRVLYIESLNEVGTERSGQLNITSERVKLMEVQRSKLRLETKQMRENLGEEPNLTSWGAHKIPDSERMSASAALNEATDQIDLLANILHEAFSKDYSHVNRYYE